MADDDTKTTYYGYQGDSTPDWNSAHGIGDRDNQLVGDYSVALTQAERLARFGVTGKSTGQEFEYEGRTRRDDDTAPERDRRVDIYQPGHPPDRGGRAQAPAQQPDDAGYQAFMDYISRSNEPVEESEPPLEHSPESEDVKPRANTQTPLEAIRDSNPRFKDWSEDKLLTELQERAFPEVPRDKLSVYARQPDGAKLIRDFMSRDLNPLERFRKFYPNLATKDDEADINWMHDHLEPQTPLDQFRQKVKPPGPIHAALSGVVQGLIQGFNQIGEGSAGLNKAAAGGTVGAINAISDPRFSRGDFSGLKPPSFGPAVSGLNAGMQATYGKWEQFPGAANDALTNLYKTAGVYGWMQTSSDWLSKNVPGYGGTRDFFRKSLTALTNRGKEWEKQAAEAERQIPADPTSQVQGTLGEIIGQTPDIAVSFALGSKTRAAALWGMLYEGTSAYGHAVENQQKNALLQGADAAGFRQFAQYLMNTGKGRLVSGIMNAFASVGDDEIQKWARGDPNNGIDQESKAFGVGALTGLLIGGGRAPEVVPRETAAAEAPPAEAAPAEAAPQYSYAGAEDTGAKFNFDHHAPEVREEFQKMYEASYNGDHDKAAVYLDRGLSLMPDGDKRKLAQDFANKIDELSGEKPKAPQELFSDYYNSGVPWMPESEDRAAYRKARREGVIPEPHAIQQLRKVNPEAADRWRNNPDVDAKLRYLADLEHNSATPLHLREGNVKGKTDAFNDYYFAGIPMPKQMLEWWEDRQKDWEGIRVALRPESTSPEAEVAGQIVKGEEARSVAAGQAIPHQISLTAGAKNVIGTPWGDFFGKLTGDINRFRHGDRAEAQERYANNFNEAQQIQQFIDYQEGRPVKDPTTQWLFQNVMKPVYDTIQRREEKYGIDYTPRENYFYQLLSHPKDDLPRLRDSLKRHGIDPDFVKPRQMTLALRLALGHRMKTTNWVRLMQLRWWASERQIQKIRDLRELESSGLAYNTKSPNLPSSVKDWEIMGAANHETYHVSPRVHPVLNNKFDPSDIYKVPVVGPYAKFSQSLKGAVAAKLSWSGFHPLHILGITNADAGAIAVNRIMAGKGTWANWFDLLSQGVPVAGGIPRATWAYLKYGDVTNALQGRADLNRLPQSVIQDMNDVTAMGIVPEINSERQMQFMKWMHDSLPSWAKQDSMFGSLIKGAGRQLVDPVGFQTWWFGTVTPRLKVASALMRRDALRATDPQLFRTQNRDALLREYGNIHRDVEGRFGELHYPNLLWPRWLRQFMQTQMLSLGWQLGMFRTMGDGIIDLTHNTAHMNNLKAEWKARGLNPSASKFVTNRMAFQALYVAQGLLTGWAISALIGGKKNPTVWDGVYPVVGTGPDGKEKRVNMQYFFKDVPAFWEYSRMKGSTVQGGAQMALNKMNPMLMATLQALSNQDFMGHTIGDPGERFQYWIAQGFEPISAENLKVPGQTNTDRVLDVLGYTPSGRWTMRSDWENKVLAQWVGNKNYGPLFNARDQYRQAFLANDRPAMQEAHDNLVRLNERFGESHAEALATTQKQVKNIQKTAKTPTAQKHFKELPRGVQIEDLKQMSPQERREWLKYASPQVQGELGLAHTGQ
jgi:hypothetical protein